MAHIARCIIGIGDVRRRGTFGARFVPVNQATLRIIIGGLVFPHQRAGRDAIGSRNRSSDFGFPISNLVVSIVCVGLGRDIALKAGTEIVIILVMRGRLSLLYHSGIVIEI